MPEEGALMPLGVARRKPANHSYDWIIFVGIVVALAIGTAWIVSACQPDPREIAARNAADHAEHCHVVLRELKAMARCEAASKCVLTAKDAVEFAALAEQFVANHCPDEAEPLVLRPRKRARGLVQL